MRKESSMNEDTTDVNTETTEASSAENQTVETSVESSDQSTDTKDSKVSEAVPYERFTEINSKNKALEKEIKEIKESIAQQKASAPVEPKTQVQRNQEALVKEQLKKMGFTSSEDVDARFKQLEADNKLSNELKSLEGKYDGSDGRPKFGRKEVLEYARDHQIGDVESAYKLMNYDQLLSHSAKHASDTNKPVKSETSDGSGSSQAGTTNKDLLGGIKRGDKSSLNSFIKRMMK